jgi:hypothetical protein
VNEKGEIFVCDRYNFRIQKFTPQGEFLIQWHSAGEPDDSNHFPLGITAAKEGSIFVTDHFSHCVQKYKVVKLKE